MIRLFLCLVATSPFCILREYPQPMDMLIRLLSLIPHIIVLIAVFSYVSRRPTAEAYLMVAGTCVGTLVSIFYTVIFPLLAMSGQWKSVEVYLGIISIVGTMGAFAFAIGFLILVKKEVAANKV